MFGCRGGERGYCLLHELLCVDSGMLCGMHARAVWDGVQCVHVQRLEVDIDRLPQWLSSICSVMGPLANWSSLIGLV